MSEKIVHLIKLCVGVNSVKELQDHQQANIAKGVYKYPEHLTKNRPVRSDEIVRGGSMYWVINGMVQVRQRIVAVESRLDDRGVKWCALIFDPKLVYTEPLPKRPFQGWRYWEVKMAPKDLLEQPDPNAAGRILGLLKAHEIDDVKITVTPNYSYRYSW